MQLIVFHFHLWLCMKGNNKSHFSFIHLLNATYAHFQIRPRNTAIAEDQGCHSLGFWHTSWDFAYGLAALIFYFLCHLEGNNDGCIFIMPFCTKPNALPSWGTFIWYESTTFFMFAQQISSFGNTPILSFIITLSRNLSPTTDNHAVRLAMVAYGTFILTFLRIWYILVIMGCGLAARAHWCPSTSLSWSRDRNKTGCRQVEFVIF